MLTKIFVTCDTVQQIVISKVPRILSAKRPQAFDVQSFELICEAEVFVITMLIFALFPDIKVNRLSD